MSADGRYIAGEDRIGVNSCRDGPSPCMARTIEIGSDPLFIRIGPKARTPSRNSSADLPLLSLNVAEIMSRYARIMALARRIDRVELQADEPESCRFVFLRVPNLLLWITDRVTRIVEPRLTCDARDSPGTMQVVC